MGENSAIAWTTHTFNPWIGCTKVSPGCANCYAESFDKRVGGGLITEESAGVVMKYKALRWGVGRPRTRTSPANWKKPLAWNAKALAAGVRHRVFCSSLADVFDDEVPREWLRDLFALIKATPNLDWLLLTKRPENYDRLDGGFDPETGGVLNVWPRNVWLGVTVENQEQANRRIPLLLAQDAVVRFLSCEPLLEPVALDFGPFNRVGLLWKTCPTCNGSMSVPVEGGGKACPTCFDHQGVVNSGIDWAIIGGESGPKARPFDLSWARSLVRQCREAGVAPFVKQMGDRPCDVSALSPHHPMALRLRAHHGADPAEWPEDLRVQEFPEVRR